MAKKAPVTEAVEPVATVAKEADAPKAAVTQTVPMVRHLQPGESGPTTADVHPDEVKNMELHGWRIA